MIVALSVLLDSSEVASAFVYLWLRRPEARVVGSELDMAAAGSLLLSSSLLGLPRVGFCGSHSLLS